MIEKDTIKFVCISDTHNVDFLCEIPPGDVLIHSGDFTQKGREKEIKQFTDFISKLPHKHKIVIAGNHEMSFDQECYE
jgi:3',5'-cyclic AMP phosphodiesterase CpdA